jgi:hypothetical protein
MKKFLIVTIFGLAMLNLIDMGITTYLLTRFGIAAEINMLMQALWSISPILFITLKVTLSICFFFIATHLKITRKWMYIAVIPTTVVYFDVAGWSVYVLANIL